MSTPTQDVASPSTPQVSVIAEDTPILSAALTGKGRRILIIVVVGVLAVAVMRELSQQSRGARGPAASSYATSPAGLAALDALLRRQGVEVVQLTRPVDEAIDSGEVSTDDRLVVLDQTLSPGETEALATFVMAGGRLLGGGSRSAAWIERLWTNPWIGDETSGDEVTEVRPGTTGTLTTTGDTRSVRTLTTLGTPGVWRGLGGEFEPVVVDREFRVALARQGSFDALADPSILSNATLSSTDNAVFAVELLSGGGGRVVFAEAGHGFRSGTGAGLSAIPSNVRTLLLGFVLAVLVWMFAVGRRVGAPDLPDRPLPPGRFEHVAAVASLLGRAEKKNRSPASGDEATTTTQPKDA